MITIYSRTVGNPMVLSFFGIVESIPFFDIKYKTKEIDMSKRHGTTTAFWNKKSLAEKLAFEERKVTEGVTQEERNDLSNGFAVLAKTDTVIRRRKVTA